MHTIILLHSHTLLTAGWPVGMRLINVINNEYIWYITIDDLDNNNYDNNNDNDNIGFITLLMI